MPQDTSLITSYTFVRILELHGHGNPYRQFSGCIHTVTLVKLVEIASESLYIK